MKVPRVKIGLLHQGLSDKMLQSSMAGRLAFAVINSRSFKKKYW